MLKLNLALFISTATMLFHVIRYRIHVTVSYTPRRSRRISAPSRQEWDKLRR